MPHGIANVSGGFAPRAVPRERRAHIAQVTASSTGQSLLRRHPVVATNLCAECEEPHPSNYLAVSPRTAEGRQKLACHRLPESPGEHLVAIAPIHALGLFPEALQVPFQLDAVRALRHTVDGNLEEVMFRRHAHHTPDRQRTFAPGQSHNGLSILWPEYSLQIHSHRVTRFWNLRVLVGSTMRHTEIESWPCSATAMQY